MKHFAPRRQIINISVVFKAAKCICGRHKPLSTGKGNGSCESFDDLLNAEYGVRGTEVREKFEAEAETFCLAECLKEERRLAGLTQEQLTAKIGTKKSYISKIENGHTDIQLSTLFRIFGGLGKRVSLSVL